MRVNQIQFNIKHLNIKVRVVIFTIIKYSPPQIKTGTSSRISIVFVNDI